MDRRRNRASTRRNHGAASVVGKGGRLRCGAAAAAAVAGTGVAGAASGAAAASAILEAELDHGQDRRGLLGRARSSGHGAGVQAFSGVTNCSCQEPGSSETKVKA